MNGFDANLLSLTGRVMLAKSILLTIPGYFMHAICLGFMIPIGICEKIEHIVRRFVWGSSERVRKSTLVIWNDYCKTKRLGGLVMKKLVPQNQSFCYEISFPFCDQVGLTLGAYFTIEGRYAQRILPVLSAHLFGVRS